MRRGLVVGGAGLALFAILMAGRDGAREATVTRRPVRGATARASVANDPAVVDLRLHRLRITPGSSESVERNLFRFESQQAPPPLPDANAPQGSATPRPVPVAVGPPAVPVIPLKFIGVLETGSQAGRVAVLSDGGGNVFHGKEGDIIEGRYVMVRVGPISVDLSYLDGRGRQTIRLSGQ